MAHKNSNLRIFLILFVLLTNNRTSSTASTPVLIVAENPSLGLNDRGCHPAKRSPRTVA
ncbi:hypothetical protein [Microbacterium sp. Y-01]|jgi:hypothetical protein|uniref:hypothetical protein n=1 Tax=Microbacterium TaxID=33882 RepID=UPI0013DE2D54|nr:hypothetical protein [Microbacterium sp. Y-01]